ncbi:MAG: intein-containing RctB family protein [Candidatus Heimdallarchaeaceae archaeon]
MKKIDEVTWEISPSYKKGMRVPARLILTPALKQGIEQRVVDQITNVATLPGIQKYALALPDAHAGYGFPIGGVAAMDMEEGVISPGGVGFDINCLASGTKILSDLGYTLNVEDYEYKWKSEKLTSINLENLIHEDSSINRFIKITSKSVYLLKTKAGYEIKATEDHPFWTKEGMIPLKDLESGDDIAIYPFEGVSFEEPNERVLLNEENIREVDLGFDTEAIIQELQKRNIIPLKTNSPQLPVLLKILGYALGDGSLVVYEEKGKNSKKGIVWFYGQPEDLEDIRIDINKLGWTCSRIYSRYRNIPFISKYGNQIINSTEHGIKVSARSFLTLLHALGLPIGNKANQDWEIPSWIFELPLWMKRLFLAAFQGAEMSTPSTATGFGYTFYMPTIGINKKTNYIASGKKFFQQYGKLLDEFGVRNVITEEKHNYTDKKGIESFRIKIQISADSKNLIKFFSQINFEYNRKKRCMANLAIVYLKHKISEIEDRTMAKEEALKLYEKGIGITEIVNKLSVFHNINRRFVERVLYNGLITNPRPSHLFPHFNEFIASNISTLGNSGMVWDKIVSIEKIKEFNDYVYDFTVNHESHNFIANAMVVSNCGVRMLTTTLEEKEVKPKIRELVDQLFRYVPAGVGVKLTHDKRLANLSYSEFETILENGAQWCLENGYARKEDIPRIESNGNMPAADPSKVSQKAKSRGLNQLGTLGSGNHYLEIQVIKPGDIFDKEIGAKLGIVKDYQVTVMIHCGSRGLGHQVASDYLRTCLTAMKRYDIPILDQELASVPINTKEGQDYFAAMSCASNMAFANRQIITHNVRNVFTNVFGKDEDELGLDLIYDVAHNIAKIEEHDVDGTKKKLMVHRKGATRSFPPGHPEIPKEYQSIGQPIILGGSMETGSYLLTGTKSSMEVSFGSTAHGAGRTMSRSKAKRKIRGDFLQQKMREKGIYVKGASMPGLAEEAGFAYKNIDEVVKAIELSGIGHPIVRVRPIGNVKG